jgi:hypothetical protein
MRKLSEKLRVKSLPKLYRSTVSNCRSISYKLTFGNNRRIRSTFRCRWRWCNNWMCWHCLLTSRQWCIWIDVTSNASCRQYIDMIRRYLSSQIISVINQYLSSNNTNKIDNSKGSFTWRDSACQTTLQLRRRSSLHETPNDVV